MHKPTERVTKVLLTIANELKGLNLSSISQLTNIPKSTLSPILDVLRHYKLIFRKDDNTYIIGENAYLIGKSYEQNYLGFDTIKEYMKKIVLECNEICQLAVLREDKVLYIAKEEPNQAIQLVSYEGKLLPASSTALGKVLLSQFTDDQIKKIIGNDIKKINQNTITNIDDLLLEIDNARNNQFAIDMRETSDEIICLAVPILKNGKIICAISVSIPVYRFTEEKLNFIKQVCMKYKNQIESRFSDKDHII